MFLDTRSGDANTSRRSTILKLTLSVCQWMAANKVAALGICHEFESYPSETCIYLSRSGAGDRDVIIRRFGVFVYFFLITVPTAFACPPILVLLLPPCFLVLMLLPIFLAPSFSGLASSSLIRYLLSIDREGAPMQQSIECCHTTPSLQYAANTSLIVFACVGLKKSGVQKQG